MLVALWRHVELLRPSHKVLVNDMRTVRHVLIVEESPALLQPLARHQDLMVQMVANPCL